MKYNKIKGDIEDLGKPDFVLHRDSEGRWLKYQRALDNYRKLLRRGQHYHELKRSILDKVEDSFNDDKDIKKILLRALDDANKDYKTFKKVPWTPKTGYLGGIKDHY